jgi:hypothetical protein
MTAPAATVLTLVAGMLAQAEAEAAAWDDDGGNSGSGRPASAGGPVAPRNVPIADTGAVLEAVQMAGGRVRG